jgi:plastocyanin
MKKFIGLLVLMIVLVMVSGCTQPAKTANVTTVVTTIVPTTLATTVPTTEATPVTTTVPVATITQNITTMATTVATVAKTPAPVMTPSTKITTIYIRNNTFVPAELTVLPGTGVIWVNDDATVHAIKTTGSNAGKFSSGDFVKGVQWDYTFGESEGTFNVIDTYSNATCVIIVKKGESLVGNNPTIKPITT